MPPDDGESPPAERSVFANLYAARAALRQSRQPAAKSEHAMDVYVIGIGMTAFGRLPEQSVKSMTREAVSVALKDAQCDQSDIGAAWFANTRQAMLEGQNTIRGQCALRAMGFEEIPIINVENACASSSTGMLSASAHIKAGLCDVALVVGA